MFVHKLIRCFDFCYTLSFPPFLTFSSVSTYVLLTLVWAECFLESRLHTQNSYKFRKFFLIFFMIFNTLLYVTQVSLYGSIFLTTQKNKVVRNIIYVGITGINFTTVILVLIFFVYLNIRFSVSVCVCGCVLFVGVSPTFFLLGCTVFDCRSRILVFQLNPLTQTSYSSSSPRRLRTKTQ